MTQPRWPLLLAGLLALAAPPAIGEELAVEADSASVTPAAQDDTPEAELTGEQIYERALANRFHAYVQDLVMQSGDKASNIQKTVLELKYKSFREEDDKILSKTITKYEAPQDVRHLGYLVIRKANGTEDQFIYRPSARRVRRINLRGEGVFGTDFSLEDILPRELEDATYNRIADEQIDGTPVFVVEVFPTKESDSEYSKFIVYVEKAHYVTIRTRYWDEYEVLTKEGIAKVSSIEVFEGHLEDGSVKQVWVPRESKMTQLKTGTFTDLNVEKLELDVKLGNRDFSQRTLAASR